MTDNHLDILYWMVFSYIEKQIFMIFLRACFYLLQLLSFLQGLFTFYHEGYELAQEFAPYKQQLQFNLQNVRILCPLCHPLAMTSK